MAATRQPDAILRHIEAGRDRQAAREGARSEEPMDALKQLDEVGPLLGGVVGNLTPDQLDLQTPCAEFTVRGVLEHMVGGATMFAAAFRGETPPEADLSEPLRDFGPALGDLLAAMSAPGAMDKRVAAPFGEVTGETFARFVALDGIIHGWDIATATGQPYDPPAGLVAEIERFARDFLDPLRDGDTFADAVEPAPDATPIERLAAYTGRQPVS